MAFAAGSLRTQMCTPFRAAKCVVVPKAFLCATPRVARVIPSILVPRPQLLSASTSSFLGGSFAVSTTCRPGMNRGALLVAANNKKSMGCTKEGTNRHRRRTSGFRTRMATTSGRAVLKRRRLRGRKVLVPASAKKTGGKK